MKPLSKEKKAFLLVTALTLVLMFVFVASLFKLFSLRVEVRAAAIAEAERGREREQVLELERVMRIHGEKISRLNEYTVAEAEVPDFIERLEGIRKTLGGTMRITSLVTDSSGEHPSLSVVLTLGGTYAQVTHFLVAIEALPLRTEITSTALSHRGGDALTGREGLRPPTSGATGEEKTAPWSATISFRVLGFVPK